MRTSLSYPELQQKFCEGFSFFPFSDLEQHGRFIYKCYAGEQNLKGILDNYDFEYNLNGQMLLLMLQQKNIPSAAALLLHLEEVSSLLRERRYGGKAEIYEQLLDATQTFGGILLLYQRDVQQNIEKQLSDPELLPDKGAVSVNARSIKHIQVVITEFMSSTDIMNDFLDGLINNNPIAGTFELPKTEVVIIMDLSRKLLQFKSLMGKTRYILKQWETQIIQLHQQQTMN